MKQRFLENIWLRVMAIIMGLLLWFHVATEKVYNHQLSLPVSQITLKDNLALAGVIPDSLEVMVEATGKQLLRKKWRSEGIRINATQFQAGRHNLNLSTQNTFLIGSGTRLTLSEVLFPTSVPISIDYLLEKSVPVIVDLIAEPDDGFAVDLISRPSPEEIRITGPKALVQRLGSISTVQKKLVGLRNGVTLTLPILKPSGENILVSPDSVEITVEVVPVKTRRFDAIPVIVYNAPAGLTVTTAPVFVEIELTGSPTDIDRMDASAVSVSVEFDPSNPGGMLAVKVDFPSRFKLKRSSPDSVKIVVSQP